MKPVDEPVSVIEESKHAQLQPEVAQPDPVQPRRVESSLSFMDFRDIPDEHEEGVASLPNIARVFMTDSKEASHQLLSGTNRKVKYIFI